MMPRSTGPTQDRARPTAPPQTTRLADHRPDRLKDTTITENLRREVGRGGPARCATRGAEARTHSGVGHSPRRFNDLSATPGSMDILGSSDLKDLPP